MKRQSNGAEYPLYNVCYKTKDGEDKVISREVTLRKGIEAIKKFDNLLLCNGALVRDILYCFLFPLRDKKPKLDPVTGLWTYQDNK